MHPNAKTSVAIFAIFSLFVRCNDFRCDDIRCTRNNESIHKILRQFIVEISVSSYHILIFANALIAVCKKFSQLNHFNVCIQSRHSIMKMNLRS